MLRRDVDRHTGLAVLALDGGDVDDAAPLTRQHVAQRVLRAPERGPEVPYECVLHRPVLEVDDRGVACCAACIVDEDVDLAVALDRSLDQGFAALSALHVAGKEVHLVASVHFTQCLCALLG